MTKVVAFGEALIDMLARTDTDGKRSFLEQPGGAPANVAVGIAKLGGDAGFVGQVGPDMFGDAIVAAMLRFGVDTQYLSRASEALTALAFVSLDATGERSFAFYRHDSADLLYRAEDCPDSLLEEAGIFHACSNTLTEPAIRETTETLMQRARAAGCLVSFDVNYRANLWPLDASAQDPIWTAMLLADLVKLSREELDALYGSAQDVVPRLLDGGGVTLVIVTDGGEPVEAYWPGGSMKLPVPEVAVVDTTAGGDAFMAGLLFQLAAQGIDAAGLKRWLAEPLHLQGALEFAIRCGAVAVSRLGAFDALATAEEVAR